jgi:hypothetical protein
MAHVRFAARDPGAANVLAAFVRDWHPAPRHHYDIWSLPQASAVFAAATLPATEFPDFDPAQVSAAWQAHPADVLVTGTSHYAPFEPLLWQLARQTAAPSLAVLDSWVNLDRRFQAHRPDFVGAVDGEQVSDLVALDFAAERIIVTGHPFLRALADLPRAPEGPKSPGAALRVLFVSEPIAEDVSRGANVPFGFDQIDAFGVVHRAAAASVQSGLTVELAIKFHPYEEPERFLRAIRALPASAGLTVRPLPRAEPAPAWVAWAQLVCGIGSMLLLEAIALGRPVVSVQPGLSREDTFIASRRGFVPRLADPVAASRELAHLMASPEARRRLGDRNRAFLDTVDTSRGRMLARWIESHIDGHLSRP